MYVCVCVCLCMCICMCVYHVPISTCIADVAYPHGLRDLAVVLARSVAPQRYHLYGDLAIISPTVLPKPLNFIKTHVDCHPSGDSYV